MTTTEIYKHAEKLASLPRKVYRMHAKKVLDKCPQLNTYDLDAIVSLYKAANQ